MARMIKPTRLRSTKYGVNEAKKAELDALSDQVINAENTVEQLQAVVNSLTEKYNRFVSDMNISKEERERTLSNEKATHALVKDIKSLMDNSAIAFDEIVLADAKTKKLSTLVNEVMNKLIFSAELINKLNNLIVRKKALNPLISDELVSMISKAGSDANNAVALTLVALESVFTAQAGSMEAEAMSALGYTEAMRLYETITGVDVAGAPTKRQKTCFVTLIKAAHTKAIDNYENAKRAERDVEDQLNEAKTKLNKAEVRLNSLKSGYAAANAAALAS